MKIRRLVSLLALGVAAASLSAEPAVRLIIDAAQAGPRVSPMMHGVFFEDINYGADGGLYAELVQNRSFEHEESLFAWAPVNRDADGNLSVETADPLNANNQHYLRLNIRNPGKGFGAANYGFGGIPVRQGENYRFSVRARADAAFKGELGAFVEDETGQAIGQCKIEGLSDQWKKFEGTIHASYSANHARLLVLATASGRVDLDVISLFPEKTWKQRPNGVRADLAQMLADMKPAFMRFPGGCIVEGKDLPNAYRWKDTIGDIAERKENWNRWQDALRPGQAPQYYYGSPSYHVQAMYSRNRPDVVLPVRIEGKAGQPLYAVAGRDEKAEEIVLDVVNPGGETVSAEIEFRGAGGLAPQAKVIVLTSGSADDENSLEAPTKVAPREETVKIAETSILHTFPARSFTVVRLREIQRNRRPQPD